MEKDLKLKLRYGRLKTQYRHFTVLMEVLIISPIPEINAMPGKAWAGLKMWATDTGEATILAESVAGQFGIAVSGRIEVYATNPVEPPRDNPYAYDLNFSYYND